MDWKNALEKATGYICAAIVYISLVVWCVGMPVALLVWNLKHWLK